MLNIEQALTPLPSGPASLLTAADKLIGMTDLSMEAAFVRIMASLRVPAGVAAMTIPQNAMRAKADQTDTSRVLWLCGNQPWIKVGAAGDGLSPSGSARQNRPSSSPKR